MPLDLHHSLIESPVKEVWSVSSHEWHAALQKEGIDPAKAKQKLIVEGIEISFEEPPKKDLLEKKPEESCLEPRLIYDYGDTKVCYSPSPKVRNHLWVILTRPIKHFREVTGDEMAALQSTVNKVELVFQEKFQTPYLSIAKYSEPRADQPLHQFIIELWPPTSLDAFDALQKAKEQCHVFTGKDLGYPPNPLPEEIEEDLHLWKQAFANHSERPLFSEQIEDEPFKNWIFVSKNDSGYRSAHIDSLYKALLESGVPIRREIFFKPASSSERVTRGKTGCALCNPAVIESQCIAKTKFSSLFCNYKSMKDRVNFLVISNRHVQKLSQLREEEIKDLHEFTQKVIRVLEEKNGSKKFAMLTQEGFLVGQTEPHVHTHLHADPSALRYHFHHLDYGAQKPLSQEELASIVQGLRKLFNE